MKTKILPKKSLFMIGLVVLICLTVLIFAIINRNEEKTAADKEKIGVIESKTVKKIPDGETREYILPTFLVSRTGRYRKTASETLQELKEDNTDYLYFENAYVNADESITVILTNEQLERWITIAEQTIEKEIKNNRTKMEISISEDYKNIDYYVTSDCKITDWDIVSLIIYVSLIRSQIFSGVSPEDVYVIETVIAKETDEIVSRVKYPQESFSLKSTEWDAKVRGD